MSVVTATPPPLWTLRRLVAPRTTGERVLLGLIGFVAVILIWELGVELGLISRGLLSRPTRIWNVAVIDFGSGVIWPHITTSLSEFALGFGAALVIGIPIGLVIGWFRRVDYVLSALLAGLNATPNVALIPLIVLIAGIGVESKAIVVFLSAFFAIVVTTFTGVQSIARRHLEITRSFGGSRWLAFRSVAIPSAIPFILSGIRIGAGRGLVGVVSAEIISSTQGVGFYISLYGTFLDTSRVMLGIILFGLFGLIMGEMIRVLEKRFEVWRPEIH
ncbi:MAG TPA: ABC transporter permease [Candidatus Limnocylindria bacterium]|nr:ABC transporter permease [Candidatus Limnocylindria bacterium]